MTMGNTTFKFAENSLFGLNDNVDSLQSAYSNAHYGSREWDDPVSSSFEGVVSKLKKEAENAIEVNRSLCSFAEQIDEKLLERHSAELENLQQQLRGFK